MNSESYDQVLFEMANSAHDTDLLSPFDKVDQLITTDNNANSDYSSGQVVFESTSLTNNSRSIDYQNGIIDLPIVLCVSATGVDFTTDDIKDSDFCLALKNSNYNLIHQYSILYDNKDVVQNTSFSNAYINFKLNTEMTYQDELLNGEMIGYSKDNATSWCYESATASGVSGQGLTNNRNSIVTEEAMISGSVSNMGLKERQMKYVNLQNPSEGLSKNMTALFSTDKIKTKGYNYVENANGYKVYYLNAFIRMKDLLFFEKLPLLRGVFMKLTLNINQCYFQVEKKATGELEFKPSSLQISGGSGTNPVMFASNSFPIKVNVPSDAVTNAKAEAFVNCGSSSLPDTKTYDVSLSIVSPKFTAHSALGVSHKLSNCRMIVNAYQMKPEVEKLYLEKSQRNIIYTDIMSNVIYNVAADANFSHKVTTGIKNAKRLIIMPVLSHTANGSENTTVNSFSPLVSPFTGEPSHCSPHAITNFNVSVSGLNVYSNAMTVSYQQFLSEMNGQYSEGGNLETGNGNGSRISYLDYINLYGYIVVDLRRRPAEYAGVSESIEITGINSGLKAVDLYCFIEYEKNLTIDTFTSKPVD